MAYTCVFTFTGHTDSVNALEFSPRAQFLASGGDNGILYILDFKTGREVRKLVGTSPITALCWHPSYRNSSFAGYGDGRVVLENTGENTGIVHPISIRMLRANSPLKNEIGSI